MNFGEDTLFNIKYLDCCKSVKIIDYAGYNVNLTENSLSRRYVYNSFEQMKKITREIETNKKIDKEIKDLWSMRGIKIFFNNEAKKSYCVYRKNILKHKKYINSLICNLNKLDKHDRIVKYIIKYRMYFVIYCWFKSR